ncbi:unnamed protein product [Meloidogyne enterolobii]|uniref:Uncharacterized protein n=1 Tax=Meloidogyne enterolobii TaxID=390850 RepID=A0ACB0ZJW9_MELEN
MHYPMNLFCLLIFVVIVNSIPNYYEILKVSKDASTREIKTAYKRLMLRYHPDKNKDNPDALEYSKKIIEAYGILCDEKNRMEYDKEVNKSSGSPTTFGESSPSSSGSATTSGESSPSSSGSPTTSGESSPSSVGSPTTSGESSPSSVGSPTTSGESSPSSVGSPTTSGESSPSSVGSPTTSGESSPSSSGSPTTSGESSPSSDGSYPTFAGSSPKRKKARTNFGISYYYTFLPHD